MELVEMFGRKSVLVRNWIVGKETHKMINCSQVFLEFARVQWHCTKVVFIAHIVQWMYPPTSVYSSECMIWFVVFLILSLCFNSKLKSYIIFDAASYVIQHAPSVLLLLSLFPIFLHSMQWGSYRNETSIAKTKNRPSIKCLAKTSTTYNLCILSDYYCSIFCCYYYYYHEFCCCCSNWNVYNKRLNVKDHPSDHIIS